MTTIKSKIMELLYKSFQCEKCSDTRLNFCSCQGGTDGYGSKCSICQGCTQVDCPECLPNYEDLYTLKQLCQEFIHCSQHKIIEQINAHSLKIARDFQSSFQEKQTTLDLITGQQNFQPLDMKLFIDKEFLNKQNDFISFIDQNDGLPKNQRFKKWAFQVGPKCQEALPEQYDLKKSLFQFSKFWEIITNYKLPFNNKNERWTELYTLFVLEFNRIALEEEDIGQLNFLRSPLPKNFHEQEH